MRAGSLRHEVIIQEPVRTKNDDGSYDITWTNCTNGTIRVSIEPLKGDELFQARQTNSRATHKVRGRYFPGLSAHHRFEVTTLGNRIFNLDGPPLDAGERHREFEARCFEDMDRKDGD